MDTQIDNEAMAETLMQIHYYTLLPKHIKGIVQDLKAFNFKATSDLLNLVPA